MVLQLPEYRFDNPMIHTKTHIVQHRDRLTNVINSTVGSRYLWLFDYVHCATIIPLQDVHLQNAEARSDSDVSAAKPSPGLELT